MPSRPKSWVLAAVVAFSLFLDYFLYGAHLLLVTHSPARLRSETELAWLYGAYAVSVLLVTPVFGWLGAWIGNKPILLCGVALAGAATALIGLGSSFQLFVWARLFEGAASAALWTSGLALIAANYVERRVEMMGYAFTGSTAGSVLGPFAGGFLSQAGGYSLTFIIVGILLALDAALILTFLGGGRSGPKQIDARRLLLNKSLIAPALAVALAAFAVGIIEPLLPARLTRYGMTSKTMGLIFTVSTLVYGLSAPIVGRISERLSMNRVVALGAIGMAVSLPLLAAFRQAGLVCIVVSLVYVAFAFMLNPASAELGNVVDRSGTSCYSAAYAIYNVVYSIGMLATAALASGAAHSLGFLGALLCVSALLLVFVSFLMSGIAGAKIANASC